MGFAKKRFSKSKPRYTTVYVNLRPLRNGPQEPSPARRPQTGPGRKPR